MGPFTLSDYVGLDTMLNISNGWRDSRVPAGEIDPVLVEPVKKLEELVNAGKLGNKTGEGYFKHEKK